MEMKKIVLAVALVLGMAAPAQVRAGKLAAGLGIAGALGVLASFLPIYECKECGQSGSEGTHIKLQALRDTLENYKNSDTSDTTVTLLSSFKVWNAERMEWQDAEYKNYQNADKNTDIAYTLSRNWASTTISPWCGRLFWGGLGAMALAVSLSI